MLQGSTNYKKGKIMINLESAKFSQKQLQTICKTKSADYVCDTELNNNLVSIFYGDVAHPVSGSRYFGLYHNHDKILMIIDGSFVEGQTFDAVEADNGEIIFSRYRHDYRESADGSVFIDGGRDYTRTNFMSEIIKLGVKDGKLQRL
jgi:hypothetical protein